jgi:hypothetical protein
MLSLALHGSFTETVKQDTDAYGDHLQLSCRGVAIQ